MRWLYRYSIDHPLRVVVVALLITGAVAPGSMRLRLRTDGHALVPDDAEAIRIDREVRDRFGVLDPIVVLVESDHPDGVINPGTLRLIQTLTATLQDLEDVNPDNVLSLATEKGDRVVSGTFHFRTFLDPLPQTRVELNRLRGDLDDIGLYDGTIVSRDRRAAAVFVGTPVDADRTAFYGRIRATVGKVAADLGATEKIRVIGAPVAEALLGTHILEDLGVPEVVLGHEMPRSAPPAGDRSLNLHRVRLLIAHRIGLVPVAMGVMALVFLISFRSLTATMLPLMEVGACLAFVFGLMGWTGVPVYLTIAVLPVILTVVGVADEIHIFSRYRQQLRTGVERPQRDVVRATLDEMFAPVVKTSITTSVGFLSFALSPMAPVRAFGVFTAAGIMFCMLWSLTVVPALLTMSPSRWLVSKRFLERSGATSEGSPALARLGTVMMRLRYPVAALAAGLMLAAPQGVRRIAIQDSWIDGFAPDSEFYQATQTFNRDFLGTHLLFVAVDAGEVHRRGELPAEAALTFREVHFPRDFVENPRELVGLYLSLRRADTPGAPEMSFAETPTSFLWNSRITDARIRGDQIIAYTDRKSGLAAPALRLSRGETVEYELTSQPFNTPETVQRVGELESFIASQQDCAVGGVLGPAAYARTTRFLIHARDEARRRIPDDDRRMKETWDRYETVRGAERLRQLIDDHYARGLITVYMNNANFVDTARLIDRIEAYEAEHLEPEGISLQLAGDVAVSQTLIGAIVTTQTVSLLGSIGGIFLVTAVMGRSLKWGLYCVLPCGLAVLVNFAAMGVVGMPLGVATSMFAGMTLGIGVDFAIHLMERFRFAREHGAGVEDAVRNATGVAGPAIVIDALAVGLGFSVMVLSQVPANARLGGLLCLSIVGCLAATMLLLPALLRLWPPRAESSD